MFDSECFAQQPLPSTHLVAKYLSRSKNPHRLTGKRNLLLHEGWQSAGYNSLNFQ
jgi:hypothetical protein